MENTQLHSQNDFKFKYLEPYKLFNKINNSVPLLFLDCRSIDRYNVCSLGASIHVDSIEKFNRIDEHFMYVRGFTYVVLVEDQLVTDVFLRDVCNYIYSIVTSGWSKVIDIDKINFDSFYSTYKKCKLLFSYENKTISLTQYNYYASEVIPNFLYLGIVI